MRVVVGLVSAVAGLLVGLTACQSQSGGGLIPLSRPAPPPAQATTTTESSVATGTVAAESSEQALEAASFALHNDVTALIKEATFGTELGGIGAELQTARGELANEHRTASCGSAQQADGVVVRSVIQVENDDRALLDRAGRVHSLIQAVTADRAAVTSAVSSLSTSKLGGPTTSVPPEVSDAVAASAAAASDTARAAAAVSAATSLGATSVSNAQNLAGQAASIVTKECG